MASLGHVIVGAWAARVAPGARVWSARGLAVMAVELAWFEPLAVWTAWPRGRRMPG